MKKLIYVILLVILANYVNSQACDPNDLNNSNKIKAAYILDETGFNYTDSVSSVHFYSGDAPVRTTDTPTNSNYSYSQTFDITESDYLLTANDDFLILNNFTVDFHLRLDALPSAQPEHQTPFTYFLNSGNRYGWFTELNKNDNKMNFYTHDGVSTNFDQWQTTTVFSSGIWYHVTLVYNNSQPYIYINGSLDGSLVTNNAGNIGYSSGNMQLEAGDIYWTSGLLSRELDGELHGVTIFNGTLNSSCITYLETNAYPFSAGGGGGGGSGPFTVTHIAPANNTRANASANIGYNMTYAANCSLYVEGLLNQTQTVVADTVYNFTLSFDSDGHYNYYIWCNNTLGNESNTSIYNYIYDAAPDVCDPSYINDLKVHFPMDEPTFPYVDRVSGFNLVQNASSPAIPDREAYSIGGYSWVQDFSHANTDHIFSDKLTTVDYSEFTLNYWIKLESMPSAVGETYFNLPTLYYKNSTTNAHEGLYSRFHDTPDCFLMEVWNKSTGVGERDSVNCNSTLTTNKWYFVSYVFDSDVAIWINGTEEDLTYAENSTEVVSWNAKNTRMYIGDFMSPENSWVGAHFDGDITGVTIFNKALNRSCIIETMNNAPSFTAYTAPAQYLNIDVRQPTNGTINTTQQVNVSFTPSMWDSGNLSCTLQAQEQNYTLLYDFDNITWGGGAATITIQNDSMIEGTGRTTITANNPTSEYRQTSFPVANCSNADRFSFWFMSKNREQANNNNLASVRIGLDTTNYIQTIVRNHTILNNEQWYEIDRPLSNYTVFGSPDLSVLDFIRVYAFTKNASSASVVLDKLICYNSSDITRQTNNNFNIANNTETVLNFTANTEGNYEFWLNCTEQGAILTNRTQDYNYIMDTAEPDIIATYPSSGTKSDITNESSLTLNITCSDDNLLLGNLTIRYDNLTGTIYYNNETNMSGMTSYTWNGTTWYNTTWPVGRYHVLVDCWDQGFLNHEHLNYTLDKQTNLSVYVSSVSGYLSNFSTRLIMNSDNNYDFYTNAIGNVSLVWLDANQNYTVNANLTGFFIPAEPGRINATAANHTLTADVSGVIAYIYDESTQQLLTWRNVTIEMLGVNSSVYTTNTGTKTITGIPSGAYEIRYYADDYFPRSYYATLNTTVVDTIYLYLLNQTPGDRVIHTVYDQDSQLAPNITVQLHRYYANESAYKIVSMSRTNFEGQTALYVELYDTYYKIVYQDQAGTIVKITDPTPFYSTETSDTVDLEEDSFLSWREYDNVLYNISFINSSGTIYARFFYSDTRNIVRSACLNVQRITPQTIETVCNNCTNAASATITCLIDHTRPGQFKAAALIDSDTTDSWYTVLTLWYLRVKDNPLGKEGVFYTGMVVITMALMGVASVTGSIILLLVGLIAMAALSFIVGFNMGILYYFIILGFIVIFLVRKSKE